MTIDKVFFETYGCHRIGVVEGHQDDRSSRASFSGSSRMEVVVAIVTSEFMARKPDALADAIIYATKMVIASFMVI